MEANMYSVCLAYTLGNNYLRLNKWLAAELCYSLPLIKKHPFNCHLSGDILPMKLPQFIQFKNQKNPTLRPTEIPHDALKLIKSFYSPWLQEHIKPDLIKRSKDHTVKRGEKIIEIFNEVRNKDKNIGLLDISSIVEESLNLQLTKINNWKGPSFNKLQYKKNKTNLTVVMEFKDYRKRCRNSQEDWFKKYDAMFFTKILRKIMKIFADTIDNQCDLQFICIDFIKKLIECKIQFHFAAKRLLLPAGTLFGDDELQNVLKSFNLKLNAEYIKKITQSKKVKDLHDKLLIICNEEYDKINNHRINTQYDDDDYIDLNGLLIPDFDDGFTVNNNIDDNMSYLNDTSLHNVISTGSASTNGHIDNEYIDLHHDNNDNDDNLMNINNTMHITTNQWQNISNNNYLSQQQQQQQTYDINLNETQVFEQINGISTGSESTICQIGDEYINNNDENELTINITPNQWQNIPNNMNLYQLPQQQQAYNMNLNETKVFEQNQNILQQQQQQQQPISMGYNQMNPNVVYNHNNNYNIHQQQQQQQQQQQSFIYYNNNNNNNNYNDMNNNNIPNLHHNESIPDTLSTVSYNGNICTKCGEQQCQCHLLMRQHFNHQNQQNHHRQFQGTNNFLNPSHQIHHNLNHSNNRNERQLAHIQEMRMRMRMSTHSYNNNNNNNNNNNFA